MDLTRWKDHAQIAAAIATVGAAVVAILTLLQSAATFEEQTSIQANQAAHNAVQEHMKLRVENPEINDIQNRLGESPDGLEQLDSDDRSLYINVAEHGVAMAEYVYKLTGEDKGWRDTVEGWIQAYQPYLLGPKIDCGDYDSGFVDLIAESINASRFAFCADINDQAYDQALVLLKQIALAVALSVALIIIGIVWWRSPRARSLFPRR